MSIEALTDDVAHAAITAAPAARVHNTLLTGWHQKSTVIAERLGVALLAGDPGRGDKLSIGLLAFFTETTKRPYTVAEASVSGEQLISLMPDFEQAWGRLVQLRAAGWHLRREDANSSQVRVHLIDPRMEQWLAGTLPVCPTSDMNVDAHRALRRLNDGLRVLPDRPADGPASAYMQTMSDTSARLRSAEHVADLLGLEGDRRSEFTTRLDGADTHLAEALGGPHGLGPSRRTEDLSQALSRPRHLPEG